MRHVVRGQIGGALSLSRAEFLPTSTPPSQTTVLPLQLPWYDDFDFPCDWFKAPAALILPTPATRTWRRPPTSTPLLFWAD